MEGRKNRERMLGRGEGRMWWKRREGKERETWGEGYEERSTVVERKEETAMP
jgi:hypothetical protein